MSRCIYHLYLYLLLHNLDMLVSDSLAILLMSLFLGGRISWLCISIKKGSCSRGLLVGAKCLKRVTSISHWSRRQSHIINVMHQARHRSMRIDSLVRTAIQYLGGEVAGDWVNICRLHWGNIAYRVNCWYVYKHPEKDYRIKSKVSPPLNG